MSQDLQELVRRMEPELFSRIHDFDPTLKQAFLRVGARPQPDDECSCHNVARLRIGMEEGVKTKCRFPEICLTR